MHLHDILQPLLFFVILCLTTPLLGSYIAKVLSGNRTCMSPLLMPVERWIYRLSGIDAAQEMTWKHYTVVLLGFNALGLLAVFLLQVFQQHLGLNPQHMPRVPTLLALNTAISFITNTNWQAYSGETTLSYLAQMAGLAVQNFLSAATGIAVFAALVRGLVRHSMQTIGNFWTDIVRTTVYILLPLSVVLAVILAGQGVVQTFSPYKTATTIEGQQQTIPLGPAASQIAIKQLGTNGGGFFNANSAHPFENPTPLSNFLEMLALLLIPTALTFAFGRMIGSRRQGWALFITMMLLLVAGFTLSMYAEHAYNPVLNVAGGSLEGKELRFGITNSVLFSTTTTATSCGAVNAMHESLTPLAVLVALFNMMLGEVVFGGVGTGMYCMILYVIITVFIAGLMVGRTPEYLGKKISSFEIRMAIIGVLASSIVILFFSAAACTMQAGLASLSTNGMHGLTEILYAFTSCAGNNGSSFAGLNAATPFYTITTGLTMLIGRFSVIVPVLAIAGYCAAKKTIPFSKGTFPTDGPMFIVLLIGTVIIIGALNFFPVLSLGPILEHLMLISGRGM